MKIMNSKCVFVQMTILGNSFGGLVFLSLEIFFQILSGSSKFLPTIDNKIKEKVFGFVSFKEFSSYFVSVVSCDVSTIHCETSFWEYVSKSLEDFENSNQVSS